MVVLVPMLEGEKTRVCSKCGLLGIASPDTKRTSFYMRNRRGSFRGQCRQCYANELYRRNRSKPKKPDLLPKHLARMTEDQRIDWHLERERRGIPLLLVPVGRPQYRGRPAKYKLPIHPLREWIEGLVAQEAKLRGRDECGELIAVESVVADRLDIDLKMLWRWRREVWEIDERWVDHVTRSEGSIRPEDLYPELECDA